MGYRAVRRQLKQKTILKEQLTALLMATETRPNVRLLFPMITNVNEIIQARELFQECRLELEANGSPTAEIEIGMMFEVPSTLLLCEKFMKEITVGGADLAYEIGPKILKEFQEEEFPLLFSVIKAIYYDQKREINW